MSTISNKRVQKAVLKYMGMNDYEIIDDDFDGCCIVAIDTQKHALSFTTYAAEHDKMPQRGEFDRSLFELRAAKFLLNNPEYTNIPVRADAASLLVIENDRALLKYEAGISC